MSNRDYDRDREGDYDQQRSGNRERSSGWQSDRWRNRPWERESGYQGGQEYGGYMGQRANWPSGGYSGEPSRYGGYGYDSGYGGGFERSGGRFGPGYEEGYGENYHGNRPWYQEGRGWHGQGWGGNFGNQGYGYDQSQGWRNRGRFSGMGPENYHRSDDRIREDVNDRLTEHGEIDASHINVQVNSGEVTLSGDVDDRWMKRMAEDVAESVPGVRDVRNELKTGHAEHRNQRMQGRAQQEQQQAA